MCFFARTLFAFLADTSLTLEAETAPLREDFRYRALWAAGGLAVVAAVVRLLAGEAAPEVRTALPTSAWGWPFPWLIAGEMRLQDVAAPEATLRLVLLALVAGSLLLVPALVYLYMTFEGRSIFLPPGGGRVRKVGEGFTGPGGLMRVEQT